MLRAHNRDGLPEIATGLNCLFVSSLIYAQTALPKGSIGFTLAVLAFLLLLLPLILGSNWALQWVRRRYLIEREGYVEGKPMGWRQVGIGIVGNVLVVFLRFIRQPIETGE